ncbi:hypothetical protein AA0119_g1169 [Alternaria tenuissima]|uniref:Uncharacterized protein n=1 Tax=Alternaria tenuissima TaxID=119927 RepID=A0A4Q4S6U0_9PLEO|nr:hypothetical protein AA0115_g2149 [Alternaria tenuissima]RYN60825.1 hypothetical protein AA0114_g1028 [Alternaria tenuissima]RYN91899.1 hypothetical protein AA0120_g5290 [Alternaria tenuissima]RYO08966.1 hypothetical protein AA0119_g1169 [Alternaria tenuissima]RYO22500.1 hypothetical protein AA0121_g2551 [Alternaria tenuissima]
MTLPPLPQSADKSAICARLGLNEHTHKLLLNEAVFARNALSSNYRSLTEQSRADPSVAEPYRWDEISETAKHSEILKIVRDACAETRPYYDMGRYWTQVNEENWVARWYLWHSFRYRDNRPRERAAPSGVGSNNGGTQLYYDPARDYYRG